MNPEDEYPNIEHTEELIFDKNDGRFKKSDGTIRCGGFLDTPLFLKSPYDEEVDKDDL